MLSNRQLEELNRENRERSFFPTSMTQAEYNAMKRAEIEHGEHIAVRMNPQTFKVEYYDERTGEIVSSHL